MTLPINFKTVFHSSSVSPAIKEKNVSRGRCSMATKMKMTLQKEKRLLKRIFIQYII